MRSRWQDVECLRDFLCAIEPLWVRRKAKAIRLDSLHNNLCICVREMWRKAQQKREEAVGWTREVRLLPSPDNLAQETAVCCEDIGTTYKCINILFSFAVCIVNVVYKVRVLSVSVRGL